MGMLYSYADGVAVKRAILPNIICSGNKGKTCGEKYANNTSVEVV